MSAPVNILHLHSSFDLGGKEARAVRLMNAFGRAVRHTIVSGVPSQIGARAAIDPSVVYEIAQDPPSLTGRPSVARYDALARYMRRFDLVLTYNWGAIDGVMARRAFGKGAPPLVHHEDGFNADEAGGLKGERNMYRRIALGAAAALVVPSHGLERIAREIWKQPGARVHRIGNGIAVAAYARKPKRNAIPGLTPDPAVVTIGALAGLRAVKDLPAMVRAVGGLSGKARLVIVGEGPERERIAQAAAAMGIADRTILPGFLPDPHTYVGLFDVMALSSQSEQQPISVMEAMAAGLPIATYPVGDVPLMLAPENAGFITYEPSEVALRDALQKLASDAALRKAVGEANRAKAVAEFDESRMIGAYRALYERVLGRPGVLG